MRRVWGRHHDCRRTGLACRSCPRCFSARCAAYPACYECRYAHGAADTDRANARGAECRACGAATGSAAASQAERSDARVCTCAADIAASGGAAEYADPCVDTGAASSVVTIAPDAADHAARAATEAHDDARGATGLPGTSCASASSNGRAVRSPPCCAWHWVIGDTFRSTSIVFWRSATCATRRAAAGGCRRGETAGSDHTAANGFSGRSSRQRCGGSDAACSGSDQSVPRQ